METLSMFSSLLFLLFSLSPHCFWRILGHETDKLALLDFKSQIDQEHLGALASWNDSRNFCQWTGVICGRIHRKRVIGLDLEGHQLAGLLSPGIGNLSFLRVLNLANNSFRGNIPPEVGHLFRLETLNVSYNSFQGDIPYSLSNCSNLADLALVHNHLHGHIPDELGSLSKLIILSLHNNNLTGMVPPSIGNLSSLQQLLLHSNQLEGEPPSSIALLSNLNQLGLAENRFYGNFPSSIYNLSSLQVISLAYNRFSGSLRPDIGLALPELQVLLLSTNNFTGRIPTSLANASGFSYLDISTNNFIGDVPLNFGNLQDLGYVNLEKNQLGGTAKDDLKFITSLNNCSYLDLLSFDSNNFQGNLPMTITNLSTQLTWLGFGRNYIQGSIPEDISKLSNLYVFSAEKNILTGSIPASLGQLSKLQVLSLAGNKLTGQIPSSLGNLSGLSQLLLNYNQLKGRVPLSIRKCESLQVLDISDNEFDGSIPRELFSPSAIYYMSISNNLFISSLPSEIGKLTALVSLDVSHNNLTGTIPTTLRQCLSLEKLYMQNNFFCGHIPYLGELKGLQSIDLSLNNLSGKVPSYMVNMTALEKLNLSFNDLDGKVPMEGVFLNASAFDIHSDIRLCGGVQALHLQPCPVEKRRKAKKHNILKYILPTALLLVFGFVLLSYVLYCTRKKRRQKPLTPTLSKHFFPKVSFQELSNATGGFSEANLIGSGAFGTVYKGILGAEGTSVAVKVLNLQQPGALKSFIAECNTLRSIRHRNLVKVLTACSSVNSQGKDFKAIVYQYMPNGSLETWLHANNEQVNRHLNLPQRINIAIDVAYALFYLHEECEEPVIHCDLKPSNVLLDEDLSACVSDFGLARLLSDSTENTIASQFSSVGFQGTIGYAAPEYGMASKMSTQGDVYSFGILLLEMFTGRRPTDEQYESQFNLHDFVDMAVPSQVLEIVDQSLLSEDEINEAAIKNHSIGIQEQVECLVSVLAVGLVCSEQNPKDRMKMEEVIAKLISVRDKCLKAKAHKSFRSDGFCI